MLSLRVLVVPIPSLRRLRACSIFPLPLNGEGTRVATLCHGPNRSCVPRGGVEPGVEVDRASRRPLIMPRSFLSLLQSTLSDNCRLPLTPQMYRGGSFFCTTPRSSDRAWGAVADCEVFGRWLATCPCSTLTVRVVIGARCRAFLYLSPYREVVPVSFAPLFCRSCVTLDHFHIVKALLCRRVPSRLEGLVLDLRGPIYCPFSLSFRTWACSPVNCTRSTSVPSIVRG